MSSFAPSSPTRSSSSSSVWHSRAIPLALSYSISCASDHQFRMWITLGSLLFPVKPYSFMSVGFPTHCLGLTFFQVLMSKFYPIHSTVFAPSMCHELWQVLSQQQLTGESYYLSHSKKRSKLPRVGIQSEGWLPKSTEFYQLSFIIQDSGLWYLPHPTKDPGAQELGLLITTEPLTITTYYYHLLYWRLLVVHQIHPSSLP